MEQFPPAQETDEGYSEAPLYPSGPGSQLSNVAVKGLRTPADVSAWLSTHLSELSVTQKQQLAMALLRDLPTSVIAGIVEDQINPRLYIDFVDHLPAEICLKILSYLDPVSLIHVAMCCRSWYGLAVDRQLWERLYLGEGWKSLPRAIKSSELKINEGLLSQSIHAQRFRSFDDGHAHKKRAVSEPTPPGDVVDLEMVDVEIPRSKDERQDTEMSGISLFGGPQAPVSSSSTKSNTSVVQHMSTLMMRSPSPMPPFKGKGVDRGAIDLKGKGKALTEPGRFTDFEKSSGLPPTTLWTYDTQDGRYKLNWIYIYNMRRRLEYNWEVGKFSNFQLPHPDHPEEGHIECIYSLQYDAEYLVSGSRDRTLRIWNLDTRRLIGSPLVGHTGSVLCLQFDSSPEEDLIVSGSSDTNVIIWKFSTGQIMQRLTKAHDESVLNVKFDKRILVTCSKDKTIKIFNRLPLKPGDLGYGDTQTVSPVPRQLENFGFENSPWNRLPVKPPYTMIGCLEGHGAAVNAVQICGREIVSASGDRHIKLWDWPQGHCQRTYLGHNKGIACVQYDGRRIVSGSSDNEVKVFDRETGLEVASLRSHNNLVRTVQAGFGDLPYSVEEDRKEAKAVDEEYFNALNSGRLEDQSAPLRGRHNAGSRRPEDITAYGAKLPPGGGGGPYGRIVSGSYDQTIIIWRRDREGVWKSAHVLKQEEGADAAARRTAGGSAPLPRSPRSRTPETAEGAATAALQATQRDFLARSGPQRVRAPTPPASAPPALSQSSQGPHTPHLDHALTPAVAPQSNTSFTQMIDAFVPQGPAALQQAITSFPTMLTFHSHIQSAIDREPNAFTRSQLRQVVSAALVRAQIAQHNRLRLNAAAAAAAGAAPSASSSIPPIAGSSSASQNPTSAPSTQFEVQPPQPLSDTEDSDAPVITTNSRRSNRPSVHPSLQQQSSSQMSISSQAQPTQPAQGLAQTQLHAPAPAHPQHPLIPAENNPARVFKLQFDARRIICCSQTSTIVGWDFCNDDAELEEVSHFFGAVE